MTGSPQSPDPGAAHRGLAFWLPPNGSSNGIDAAAWAEIADLEEEELPRAIRALTDAHIGCYCVDVGRRRNAHKTFRLWVDSMRYLSAEDVLMRVLRGRGTDA